MEEQIEEKRIGTYLHGSLLESILEIGPCFFGGLELLLALHQSSNLLLTDAIKLSAAASKHLNVELMPQHSKATVTVTAIPEPKHFPKPAYPRQPPLLGSHVIIILTEVQERNRRFHREGDAELGEAEWNNVLDLLAQWDGSEAGLGVVERGGSAVFGDEGRGESGALEFGGVDFF